MKRISSSLLVVILLGTLAAADLKIKTRTTVMGHTTESTVYIKGARQRTEMSFGGRGTASIMQCDQKRMITVTGNQCMVMQLGGSGETACPAMPNMGSMARAMMGQEPEAPKKGGVVTITRNSTDTGERQEMFGYKARHIKSTMTMEASPDACNKENMKMEIDGWYADVSAEFKCGDESYKAMACGGPGGRGGGCNDRIVMKGSGSAAMGYPLKQTMTMTSAKGNYTMTTEVLELTNAALDAPLFDAPPGCKVMDMSALMGKVPEMESKPEPAAAAAPEPTTAPAPTPTVAPKAAGVVRIGVVKIKDETGQGLPTENLIVNLMSEFARHQFEPVLLDAESPHASVEEEAKAKQCDYVVYTVPMAVAEAGGSGIPGASVPKGVKLDPAKAQALNNITLFKISRPQPEIKDLTLAAEGERFGVDAVMETFVKESDKVAEQVTADAHPKAVAPKAPAKPAARKTKK